MLYFIYHGNNIVTHLMTRNSVTSISKITQDNLPNLSFLLLEKTPSGLTIKTAKLLPMSVQVPVVHDQHETWQ